MTTPASALSFHCMICFEEFHHADRYPVVLPCGHTYVCHICAERLDKCMECRTLLTWSIPNPAAPRPKSSNVNTATSRTGWSSGRALGRNAQKQTNSPPVPMEKKRLPLPKNVVLLSLIEATEIADEMAHTTTRIDSLLEDDEIDEVDEMDEIDNEEEKIKMGTSLTIGACGTYVVAEKEGLEVYPSRPNATPTLDVSLEEKDMPTEEDVNALVRFFHLDHKLEVSNSEGNLKAASSEESNALVELHYGDRVQVVLFDDDGWAKLARGYGYVRANQRQLVKVGGSVDKACRLEAYLHALANRRRELKAECGKIDTQFTGLMNNLQASLFNDEDYTVIHAEEFEDSEGSHIQIPQANGNRIGLDEAPPNDSDLLKPHALVRQPTPPMDSGLSCSMGSVLQAMSATLGGDDEPLPQSASALATLYGEAHHSTNLAQVQQRVHARARQSPPRNRELSAEAEAWRERCYHSRRRGVDFRTGLSGHQGLVSYMVHPHSYLAGCQNALPKMSSHSGLSRSVGRSPQPAGHGHSPPSLSYSRDSQT